MKASKACPKLNITGLLSLDEALTKGYTPGQLHLFGACAPRFGAPSVTTAMFFDYESSFTQQARENIRILCANQCLTEEQAKHMRELYQATMQQGEFIAVDSLGGNGVQR